jgi:ankyrin repeat protein
MLRLYARFRRPVLCALAIGLVSGAGAALAASFGFEQPLVDAADAGNIQEVSRLLQEGTSANVRGAFDTTALARASYQGHGAVAAALLNAGADPNVPDIGGATPLHLVARQGHEAVAGLLLQRGAKVESQDSEGWTPLMRAVVAQKLPMVQLLLAKGASVNARNQQGLSPLLLAIPSGNREVIAALLDKGADPLMADRNGMSAVDIAYRRNDSELVALLKEHAAPEGVAVPAMGMAAPQPATPTEMQEEQASSEPEIPVAVATGMMRSVSTPPMGQGMQGVDEASVLETGDDDAVVALPALPELAGTEAASASGLASATVSMTDMATAPIPSRAMASPPTEPESATGEVAPAPAPVPARSSASQPRMIPAPPAPALPVGAPVEDSPVAAAAVDREPVRSEPVPAPFVSSAMPAPLPPQPALVQAEPEVARPAAQVEVAEAIRVPLSVESVVPEAHPVEVMPAPRVTFYPSKPLPRRSLWLQIGVFENERKAESFWDMLSARAMQDVSGLRMLMVRPYTVRHATAATAIRLGPVLDEGVGSRLCDVAAAHQLQCVTVRSLGGESLSSGEARRYRPVGEAAVERDRYYAGGASAAATSFQTGAGGWWAQLGSYPSRQAAESRFQQLASSHKSLFAGVEHRVREPRYSSMAAPTYRLRAGPFSGPDSAEQFCRALESQGVSCLPLEG